MGGILMTGQTVASGGMTEVTAGITAIMGVATTMLDAITANPILAALFATGFVSIGVGIVRKLKHV